MGHQTLVPGAPSLHKKIRKRVNERKTQVYIVVEKPIRQTQTKEDYYGSERIGTEVGAA
jgi:hypothetical protein